MGRTIRVEDTSSGEKVTKIEWSNKNGEPESITKDDSGVIEVHLFGDVSASTLYSKDIPKLLKALEIAMENGWHND